ncbi:hypothetical protein [Vitiosangium sp. GDMCC 1.1324]|uniref:hypothetical protein n=1 Tax=Vitiosangium sp. (strain GDMCC 1.1324) TaxID=2138576 RepID=UPI000D380E8D|nr:hypothetical protein [Vitiosangium sp. GDMCC 1.1324]PTL83325.1 hypothetical protein DAT35_15180 [Vitiosangium sp. GDMCC 1.1324]
MAVRTLVAGIKNKRRVTNPREAQPHQETAGRVRGQKTLPRDQAAALRRQKLMRKATPGPAMLEPVELASPSTDVRPGKKTVTRRKTKRGNGV